MRGYEQAYSCRVRLSCGAGGRPVHSLYQLEAGGATEIISQRGLLPGEPWLAASEVAVGGGPPKDGVAQLQIADDGPRPEVEMFLHQRPERSRVSPCCAERLHHHAHRMGHPDRV